jgi:6-phosphogluconolactonase
MVGNYNAGSVAVFPINADGSLGEATTVIQHEGSSVHPQRQRGPHAHQVVLSSDNKLLFVPDLGLDKIMVYKFNAATGALTPNDPPSVNITPASGPRHLAIHPKDKFAYVMMEMTSSVGAFNYNAAKGSMEEIQLIAGVPDDFTGNKSGAEIATHPNGRFLYSSNRNHNSITVYSIGSNGRLTNAGNVLSGGRTPRHFVIDPTGAFLIASNQDSDNIVVFRIDQKTGGLTPTGEVLEVGAPVCMIFVPAK